MSAILSHPSGHIPPRSNEGFPCLTAAGVGRKWGAHLHDSEVINDLLDTFLQKDYLETTFLAFFSQVDIIK